MSQLYRGFCFCIAILLMAGVPSTAYAVNATAAVVYYVSSSAGNDANNGLSQATAFKTIAKVNTLNLQAGSSVLFKCGDTWRAEMLTITKSGIAGQPITFGSYPAGCVNKPILLGAQPISGWAAYATNIYVANLNAGANAGKFGYGVDQLFRGSARLPFGRWPNISAPDGGYSTIDAAPALTQITDNQLPAGNWSGAIAHIRGMRWYILNRQVTARAGQTLTLGSGTDCWEGSCTGWGYFLNNHLATLDSEGEWYYNTATQQVYLYSTTGLPANGEIEGSVMLKNDGRSWGAVTLGADMGQGIAFVTVENLDIQRWFHSGIATPTNYANFEPHDLIIRNNRISDVDAVGINLAVWVFSASDSRPDGWRGGYGMSVTGNTISRANNMGINLYSRNSTFSQNIIQDVGMIANLGPDAMGCALNGDGGACTQDGDGIRVSADKAADSGNNNTIQNNRILRVGYSGVDIFGYSNTIKNNFIYQACWSKADCGGIRTFARNTNTLANTPVHDLLLDSNIIVGTLGNCDGCEAAYHILFAFGIYVDYYSRDITSTGNTVVGSTVFGLLYQNSTGTVTGNTLYDNGRTYPYGGAQVWLWPAPAAISNFTNNIMYSVNPKAWTLAMSDPAGLGTSNNNAFFSPYDTQQVYASGPKTFAEWKAFSGKDAASITNWFTLASGAANNSTIFYNDTAVVKNINLGSTTYKDLNQNLVSGTLTLQPYTSKVLVIYSTVDSTPPTVVSVKRIDPSPTTLGTVRFGVVFSEPVTGVNASDFTLTTTGITGAAISTVSGSGASYTVSVGSGTGSGRIRLNVADDDSIVDASSNPLGAAGAGNGGFTGGEIYIVRPLSQKFFSTAGEDGWILESGENSSVGGAFNTTSALIPLGDDAQNRQYKAVLSFDTSALPENATLVAVKLSVYQSGAVPGKNPFGQLGSLFVDLFPGSVGTPGLSASDFQTVATTLKQVGAFGTTPTAGWYTATLSSATWANISKSGPNQFRLYFNLDDNNDHVADYVQFSSGEAASVKPELLIQYIVP